MSDLISRQAAIDAVKKNTFRLTFAEEQNCEGHVTWSANAVYSDAMEGALSELPSVQPEVKTEGDTISRQAAIDAVGNAFDRETILYGFVRTIAIRALRNLPSAQPEQKEPCSACEGLENGDTLYAYSDWDGGIGFDYIRDIKYCPVCGRRLNNG